MNKKITAISIMALVLGLFTQLTAILSFPVNEWIAKLILPVKFSSPNMKLSFLKNDMFAYHNSDTELYTNFLDLFVYLLILLGTFFYVTSKGKEIRLLRFSFSIIMLTNLITIISLPDSFKSKR